MATKTNIKERIKPQGPDIFIQEEDQVLPKEGTQPQQEPQPPTQPEPEAKPDAQSQPNTGTVTDTVMGTQTDTDTLLQQLMKPSDNYVRKVYYPLDYQEEFIKKRAKKYKRTESEILRIALDYFIKHGKI